ncbi:MAG TPA: cytochrome c maturation protein CcmE [Balneolales bacterium]|nr:cytochrome c maturation protein CcmE [Balneolales bacterium]
MKPKVIVGVIFIAGFTSLLFYNFGNSISTYMDFAQASTQSNSSNVHVVGDWDNSKPSGFSYKTKTFTFYMKDLKGNEKKVVYPKPEPNNFDQAKRLVVVGQLKDNTFYADEILMKCPSKYNADGSNLKSRGPKKN